MPIISYILGRGFAGLIPFLFIPLYIDILGIEAYGLVGFFTLMLSLSSLFDLGFGNTINREMARLSAINENPGSLLKTLGVFSWGIALILGMVVVFASGWIAREWINVKELYFTTVQQAICLMGIALLFQWPSTLYSSALIGLQKQVAFNVINTSAAIARGLGTLLVLIYLSPSIQAFFITQAAVSFLHTCALWLCLPKNIRKGKFDFNQMIKIRSLLIDLAGINFLSLVLLNLDKIILSKTLSLESFGYYSLAWTIANGLNYLIFPLFYVFFPRFSQLIAVQDDAGLKREYHKGCRWMSALILPLASVVAFFSFEAVFLWTGGRTTAQETYALAAVLIIANACNGLMHLPFALQTAFGWTKVALYQKIIGLFLLVPAMIYGVKYYGALGAAAGWLIYQLGCVLLAIPYIHKRLLKGENRTWYVQDVGIPLIISLGIVCLGKWTLPQNAGVLALILLTVAAWFGAAKKYV